MLVPNLNSNFLLIILIKVKTQKPYYHGNMGGIVTRPRKDIEAT